MQHLRETRSPEAGKPPRDAEQWEVLLRIAHGRTFHRSARLRDLLLYIGEHSLSGEIPLLAEQTIGQRVFGRPEAYNPAEDNIVRASVRQLRIKLKDYFEDEGRNERWVLQIPKGGYVAAFVPRPVPAAETAAVVPAPVPAPEGGSRLVPALGAACGVLLAACLWLAFHRPVEGGAAVESPTLFNALLRQEAGPVHFVMTDSTLNIMNPIAGRLPTVESYADQTFVKEGEARIHDPKILSIWTNLRNRQITSLADVLILARVFQGNPSAVRRIEIRHAKHMQARDFKTGNFIITGSRRSNPWTALFEGPLNFQFDYGVGIRNLAPLKGEPAFLAERSAQRIDSARVAVMPNLSGKGFVLLIAGMGMQGTEGAGEFLGRDDSLPLIRKALGLRPEEPIPRFEMVLGITTLGGTARSAQIVACRRR